MCSISSETIHRVLIRMQEKRKGVGYSSRVETRHYADGFVLSYKTSYGKVISRKYTYAEINETWKKVNQIYAKTVSKETIQIAMERMRNREPGSHTYGGNRVVQVKHEDGFTMHIHCKSGKVISHEYTYKEMNKAFGRAMKPYVKTV